MVTRVICPKTYKVLLINKILAGESPYGAIEEGTEVVIPTTAGGIAIKVSSLQWQGLLKSIRSDLIKELESEDTKMKNPPLDIATVIQQRDNAIDAFDQVYHLILGEFPNKAKCYAELIQDIEIHLETN